MDFIGNSVMLENNLVHFAITTLIQIAHQMSLIESEAQHILN